MRSQIGIKRGRSAPARGAQGRYRVHGTGLSYNLLGSELQYVQVFTERLHADRAGGRHRHPRNSCRVRGAALRAPRPAGSYRLASRRGRQPAQRQRAGALDVACDRHEPGDRADGRPERHDPGRLSRSHGCRHRQHPGGWHCGCQHSGPLHSGGLQRQRHRRPTERCDRPGDVLRAATPGTVLRPSARPSQSRPPAVDRACTMLRKKAPHGAFFFPEAGTYS